MPPRVITGEPSSTWTNDTGRIHWQFTCQFANSCGRCIEDAGKISPTYWPTPYHRGCGCRNTPVPPDHAAAPFVDYEAEVRNLDPGQRRRVMGAGNWQLVESGVVEWSDVVGRTRIRPLREVVARNKLTVERMTAAGVPPATARRAWEAVHTPERAIADAAAGRTVARLRATGLTDEQIARLTAERLTGRVGVPPIVVPVPAVPSVGPLPEPPLLARVLAFLGLRRPPGRPNP